MTDKNGDADSYKRTESGRFGAGNKGGPGRPPNHKSITHLLRQKLDPEEFVNVLLRLIRQGDLGAIKEAWRRLEGEVSQPLEHSGTITTDARERLAGELYRLATRNGADKAPAGHN